MDVHSSLCCSKLQLSFSRVKRDEESTEKAVWKWSIFILRKLLHLFPVCQRLQVPDIGSTMVEKM